MSTDFYCSQKFWWLSVDLARRQTQSCCAASPARIDTKWLADHPGHLFNTPLAIKERKMMLDNQAVDSCSSTCWLPESRGLTSRRLNQGSQQRTHQSAHSSPEVLNIIVGTDCNMTCVYCCKDYSSAWVQDIITNGDYQLSDNRYHLSARDHVMLKLGQKDFNHDQLLTEIEQVCNDSTLREIIVTGGEPFLYLKLTDLVNKLSGRNTTIRVFSGLGVSPARFKRELDKIATIKELEIVISGENIGAGYEFARNGNTWERFNENIRTLENAGVSYSFYSTVSNLTLSGLIDFSLWVGDKKVTYSTCTDPDFLAVSVMDPVSKRNILDNLNFYPEQLQDRLSADLLIDPSEEQRVRLKTYLLDFVRRRNLSLTTLPISFQDWINA
jgi:MoaA/NifB/PqqE/SkfB family radical SAM enzyme